MLRFLCYLRGAVWLLVLLCFSATAWAQGNAPLRAGIWRGKMQAGATELPLIFHIAEAANGARTATLDSPNQNAYGLPVEKVTQRADSVILQLTRPAARFAGRVVGGGKQLEGAWLQAGRSFPLTLAHQAGATANRPQEPKAPFPYHSEEVTFSNAKTNIKLAGTVTTPAGKGPFPAVVLVTGSGPQDRDETVFGHKPFWVLADYLTRRGYVVLRYDDRGVGKSGGTTTSYTTADGVTDAQAALAYLRTRPEVQARQAGLLGHSEGAMIGLIAATEPNPPAFLIALAGPAVRGLEFMLRQAEDLGRASGMSPDQVASARALNQQVYMTVLQTPDKAQANERVIALMKQAGLSAAQAQQQAAVLTTAWYRQLLAFDPQPLLPKVKCPVLALNGGKDLQVAASVNLPAWEQGVRAGGNQDVTVQELTGLNHLFQTANTGLSQEYGQIEETFSPTALQAIGDWLARHTKR
ncbi:alpha/beta hydrolase family protein [Hymenobacter latericus]|uniref:alpha/beta hydrolase family protein n=1 Tax=Hymenobacter sp. YIM 151858-1 TaxID=2987688 RepID=UPI002225D023|nr:alpha/beta fold hydrolase [Hymenobacter sp. YIM 151858-1]UYZ58779.1 alpha/beta fold hydrolase [Hymenobacter sp. YIM 151858-1]